MNRESKQWVISVKISSILNQFNFQYDFSSLMDYFNSQTLNREMASNLFGRKHQEH